MLCERVRAMCEGRTHLGAVRCRPSRSTLRIPVTCCASSVTLSREPSESRPPVRRPGFSRGSRNARAAPGVARRTFARASSVRSSARQRSAPLSRARFRGRFVRASGHTSLAREVSRRFVRASEEHTSLARTRLPRVRFWDFPKCPCVRVSHARAHRHDVSTPCARVPDRAIGGNAVDAGDEAFLERARADAAAAACQAQAPQAEIRASRRGVRTLLAIDEATSIDTRAPTARVATITSVATLTRDDAPPGALQRHVPHRPERLPVAILASSSAPASARAAPSPRPAPQPHRFHLTHPRRRRRRLRHAPSRRLSLFGLEDGRVIVRGRDLDNRTSLAPPSSCIPDGWRGCAGGRPTSRPTSRRRRRTAKRPNSRH